MYKGIFHARSNLKSIIDKDVKASLEQLEKYETANRDEAFQRAKLAYDV